MMARMSETSPRARWLVLANVIAMNFFATGMAWTYVVVLVAPILEDLGLALRDWGTIWSGVSMGALLASIPAGALGDRFGVRRVVAIGALAMAAALGLRAVAGSLPALLAAMALFGVTLATVATNLPKALGVWFPRAELGLANGFALGGNGAGQGLATWLAPLVVAQLGGWRGLTAGIAAAVGVLALLWLASVRDPAPPSRGLRGCARCSRSATCGCSRRATSSSSPATSASSAICRRTWYRPRASSRRAPAPC